METSSYEQPCYILKGKIIRGKKGKENQIDILACKEIQKDALIPFNNRGFESLAFHEGMLWAIF